MKVNIYYGGRGVVDDPTIFVVNKIQEVLDELNVMQIKEESETYICSLL